MTKRTTAKSPSSTMGDTCTPPPTNVCDPSRSLSGYISGLVLGLILNLVLFVVVPIGILVMISLCLIVPIILGIFACLIMLELRDTIVDLDQDTEDRIIQSLEESTEKAGALKKRVSERLEKIAKSESSVDEMMEWLREEINDL